VISVPEIARRLAERAEDVARMLLPSGYSSGGEWCVGSVQGESGKSCKVHLAGEKAGVWADFSTGEKGDLLDLWSAAKGVSLTEAIREAKSYLGISPPIFEGRQAKQYRRPSRPATAKSITGQSGVMEYLTVTRKLCQDSIKAYQVAECDSVGPWVQWKNQKPWMGPWVVFPYKRDNELIALKYLHLERDKKGKKQTLVEADCEPCLFGWQAINPNAREVALVEGELDALSLYQYGYPALSVPFGGGRGDKQKWVEFEWEYMERFEIIYLCMDKDGAGMEATDELVNRLGRHRCRVVILPHKDANECLQKDVAKDEIDQCFREAVTLDPEELKSAAVYEDDVIKEFYPENSIQLGFHLPWERAFNRIFFRYSELSIWTGWNGGGKSQLLGQVMIAATMQGEKVCIASFEMKPRKTLKRIVRQITDSRQPERGTISSCHKWFQDKFWIFDLRGTAKVDRMFEVFRYAYHRYGIKQFVIDSLMKCGIGEEDYGRQKAFVEQLTDFEHEIEGHVHLVAHSRKGLNEEQVVGKLDIKGTGAISDLADNVFSIWRNKRKETDLSRIESGELSEDSKADLLMQPDALLICDKQRDGEWEGRIGLYFDKSSLRYYDNPEKTALKYHDIDLDEDEEYWSNC